ncbi:unnamed protein product [Blepharisma stoltei]|uniref:Transmembrane protein n=1 Tax=Blepharisma stoltei TaxID=1481888 RepID=A0AAU9K2T0_9CILI|nr:unnamed protein product [Blepharisma stoltei]
MLMAGFGGSSWCYISKWSFVDFAWSIWRWRWGLMEFVILVIDAEIFYFVVLLLMLWFFDDATVVVEDDDGDAKKLMMVKNFWIKREKCFITKR